MATVTSKVFGVHSGKDVHEFTLSNGNGTTATVITYGAILRSLLVKGKGDAGTADVVLGFDTLDEYVQGNPFFGATVGRAAGRISGKGGSTIDGPFQLAPSDAPFISPTGACHSGPEGFDKRIWTVLSSGTTDAKDGEEDGVSAAAEVKLQLVSADGDQGFPGELTASVTYRLTATDELELSYEATTTKETPCSLTNHTYFNLAGHTAATEGGEGVRKHTLSLDCPTWLVTGTDGAVGPNGNQVATYDAKYGVSSNGIPTGEFRDVTNSPHDFRTTAVELGSAIDGINAQYPEWPHGDAYICDNQDVTTMTHVGAVVHAVSGRKMTITSTEPVCQTYFSTLLQDTAGKDGVVYGTHGGLCLEMHRYADVVLHDVAEDETAERKAYVAAKRDFTLLKPGQVYKQETVYAFSIE